jgi:hypothetical protein
LEFSVIEKGIAGDNAGKGSKTGPSQQEMPGDLRSIHASRGMLGGLALPPLAGVEDAITEMGPE